MFVIMNLFVFILFSFTNEIILEKVINSKFSNAELINNTIVISYDKGISKYSYDFKLISNITLEDLKLDSYSNIHQLNQNTFIIESSRYIYLVENDKIKYKVVYKENNFFRQVIVLDSNNFFVLEVGLTTSILNYCLFNTASNKTLKVRKATKDYIKNICTRSSLSNHNYIICFLVNYTGLYYNILDSNLTQIVPETEIESLVNEFMVNYIDSISITDNKIILLINYIKYKYLYSNANKRRLIQEDDMDEFYSESYLVAFELRESSGKINLHEIEQKKDFIIDDEIYMGNNIFHLRKIDDEEFVVVFPIDETKKEFYFSIFQFRSDTISVKEDYKNIPLSFKYEIQGLKFLKINSDFAISFYYLNTEEIEEVKEVYFAYISNRNCTDFEISTYENGKKLVPNVDEPIDFSKYISLDIVSPDPETEFMKLDNSNISSISIFYDNNPFDRNKLYDSQKWSFNSGKKVGVFQIPYTIYNSNGYKSSTCKITFKISDGEDSLKENEIKTKIEEMKKSFKTNAENNTIYETEKYKIFIYNTSKISQENISKNKDLSNIDLLDCENTLKYKYNITTNEVLIIIQVDLKRNDTNSIQVEYQIYSEKYNYLDLKYCENSKIKVNIPYDLKETKIRKLFEEISLEEKYKLGMKYNYDILNPDSPFYNDICTPFDSEFDTDLIIEDRKKYYYLPQLFCEDSCSYLSYDTSTGKVGCMCNAKIEQIYITSRNFSYNIEGQSFKKKITNVNFKVFQCVGKGFNNFFKNIGVYLILIIFIAFCYFIFCSIKYEKDTIMTQFDIGNNTSFSDILLAVMPYNLAIEYDKRNIFKIYFGTVKYNHLIWFSFLNKEYGYNPFLKKMIFLFYIILLFLFNLFLYTDKYFTNLYLDEGKYHFGKEVGMSIVAALICLLINMGIRILLNNKKNENLIFERINNTKSINDTSISFEINFYKNYKKIIPFSIIGIFLTFIIFLYVVSFGGIFVNNQIYIIIRVIFSLIITFIAPFLLCMIYTLIKYLGLLKKKELLFKIGLIAQNF